MYFKETLAAGVAKEINEAGDFFRILSSPAEDIEVIFYLQGREVGRVADVGAGYFEEIAFDKVVFDSEGGGLVRIVTRIGARVGYDRAVGSVALVGTVTVAEENGAFAHGTPAITNVDSLLRGANAQRRYMLIQNKDAAGSIFVSLDGAAATVARGVRLRPGDSLELANRCPTGAVRAIGDIANNNNIVVVEG